VQSSVSAGAAVSLHRFSPPRTITFTDAGGPAWSGAASIQISSTGSAIATDWLDAVTGITAAGIYALATSAPYIRINTTAWTAGALVATASGFDAKGA